MRNFHNIVSAYCFFIPQKYILWQTNNAFGEYHTLFPGFASHVTEIADQRMRMHIPSLFKI
jgi:hypothetical protein